MSHPRAPGAQRGHRGDLGAEEPAAQPAERLRVAGRQEQVRTGRRPGRVAREVGLHEHPHQVLRRLVGAGDERDVRPEHDLQHPGEQRVVRAAEHDRVGARPLQRLQVALREPQHLAAAGHPAFDEVDEPRAGHRRHLDVAGCGERVLVRAGGDRGAGADHADPAGPGGRDGPAHGRAQHLDDRHGVALADVGQARRCRRVTGDDQRLHPALHQRVADGERVAAHVRDAQRPVRPVCGVADVDDPLGRELVDHRPRHREPADARVEDAYRSVEVGGHAGEPRR
ncbi:hypothetical protein BJF78_18220 [Pseudonocardia sp. CNS-139]|nr:hypothetical protein BJF78_18220 [Pseudonocardia sp. CNS-139]